ncbi:MAG: ABC transporter permease [Flavobacteriales bacterium]
MNLLKIAWRNTRHKPLNTLLSIVLLSFGIGIISLMLLLEKQIGDKFNRNIKDIDFVLAAKGSPLQSILANVYHVDVPTGNIRVGDAQRVIKNPMVEKAIPLAYGDNYEKWRIVGTNADYPAHYAIAVHEGKLFDLPFETTIGALVAHETGLKIGDTFVSSHGYDISTDKHPDTPYTVVGIFEESGTVIDNLILTPVASTWLVHEGHNDEDGEHHEESKIPETPPATEKQITPMDVHSGSDTLPMPNNKTKEGLTGDEVMKAMAASGNRIMPGRSRAKDPNADKEMTAYLIIKRNRGAFGVLSNMCADTNMDLANVAVQNNRLLNNFGIGMDTIMAIAILISGISFISIFISLFNSLKERRYELALMRAMGGTAGRLFTLIITEGLLLVLFGYLLGWLLSRAGIVILGSAIKENFHYSITSLSMQWAELVLLGITLAVGVVASLLPALRALRIDISKTLSNG